MSITRKIFAAIGIALFLTASYGVAFALGQGFENNAHAVLSIQKDQKLDTAVLFRLVNDERMKAGLQPLLRDDQLDKGALAKCDDMVAKDYWAHNAPDGTEPWKFIDDTGVTYLKAGENLAYDMGSNSETVNSWMSSPGHKENILNKSYTDVGYALCHSDNFIGDGSKTIIVQHFIKKQ